MSEQGIDWPKELRSLEDIPLPVRFVSREELLAEFPPSDADRMTEADNERTGD